jgi:CheY-like chemotaxis protein
METQRRVLIEDDSKSSRDLLRFIIEDLGYEVIEAADGEEALRKAAVYLPDLFIVDLNMPRGDGWAVVAGLKRNPHCNGMPIMAISAALGEADPTELQKAGFSTFLSKPITPAQLRQRIVAMLNPASASAASRSSAFGETIAARHIVGK